MPKWEGVGSEEQLEEGRRVRDQLDLIYYKRRTGKKGTSLTEGEGGFETHL